MQRQVLIVDDNAVNNSILQKILEDEYEVSVATSGSEALAVLRKSHDAISAVFLDIVMPEMNGFEVLKEIRADQDFASMPVMICTEAADDDAEIKALSYGANDFIRKPYNAQVIKFRLRNVIELRENASSVSLVTTDELTGLYNRKAFLAKAGELIAQHPPGYYIMACFDIDSFKVINDQYGSLRGDAVLKHVAQVFLNGFAPVGGICCRVMADNFAVLYPTSFCDSDEIYELRRKAAAFDASMPPIAFSIGRYVVNDVTLAVSSMYDRASIAESSVKGRYDKHVAYYDRTMRDSLLMEQQIVMEMHYALEDKEFEIWLQPQYNHSSKALIGAEALVHWRRVRAGMLVSPGEFIHIFERNGFIYELDKYIWEQVCLLLRRWIDSDRAPLPIAVNVSRVDVFQSDFYEVLTGLVQKYKIPVDLLRLEITESAFSRSSAQIIEVIKRLVDYGFTIEIDDFGSGYSSLNILKDVPASILKLDMRFLETGEDSSRGGNILESIVRMAKWINMAVIAEGVETKEQADYLKSIGCNYVQGYLYNRPMPVTEYETLAASLEKDPQLIYIEAVEALDNNAFWDPKSMETLIFNSYVGGACIFEYSNNRAEVLRANEKFAKILSTENTKLTLEDILGVSWTDHLDFENRLIVREALMNAIQTHDEASCEVVFTNLPWFENDVYLRLTMRVLATVGNRYLIYCTNDNLTAQRDSEQRERSLTEQMRLVMEKVNSGISASIFEENGSVRYLFANEKYYEIRGYTKEQFEAEVESPFSMIHPDDRQYIEQAMRTHMEEGTPAILKYRCIRRDGTIIHVRISVSVVHFAGIHDKICLSVLSDITNLVVAEENVAKIAAQIRAIMDSIDGGVTAVTFDEQGNTCVEFKNERYYDIFGYTQEQFESEIKDVFDLVHPDDREQTRQIVHKIMETKNGNVFSYRCIKRNGDVITVRSHATVKKIPGIANDVLLSVMGDITDEVLTRQQAIQNAGHLHEIMNNIDGGVSATRLVEGRIEYQFANAHYYSMLDYTPEQFRQELPNGIVDLIHPDDVQRYYEAIERIESRGRNTSVSLEFRVHTRDGEWKWVRSNMSSYTFAEMTEPIRLAVMTDITKEKESSQKIIETSSQLRFINRVAHDLFMEMDAQKGLADLLRKTMRYYTAKRAYIFEFSKDKLTARKTCGVNEKGDVYADDPELDPTSEELAVLIKNLEKKGFVDIHNIDAMTTARKAEKEILKKRGCFSTTVVPLLDHKELIGFIGIDNPAPHLFHVELLKTIADYIVSILMRRDFKRQIQADNEIMTQLMNDTPGGFARLRVLSDDTYEVDYVNQGFCDLMKMSSEEIVEKYSKDAFSGLHPDDYDIVKTAVKGMMKENKPFMVKYRLLDNNKEYVWVMTVGRLVLDASGERFLHLYYTELSDVEKQEMSLRDILPIALSTMMESSSDLSFMKDINLNYLFCTRAFAKLGGLESEKEIVGKTDYDLFDKELAEKYRSDDRKLIEDGKSLIDYVESIPSTDGVPHYSSTSKYLLRDEFGNVIGLYGIGRDVTEYRESYKHLKLLTDSVSGGIATFSSTRNEIKTLYFNDGYCALMGYTREEYSNLTKDNPVVCVHKEDLPEFWEKVQDLLNGKTSTINNTHRLLTKSGNIIWVDFIGSATDRVEDKVFVNCLIVDVTARKLTEDKLLMNEELYRLALMQSGDFVCLYSVADKAVTMTSEVAAFFGTPVRIVNVPYARVESGAIGKESIDDYMEFYEGILRGKKKGSMVIDSKTAHGWRRFKAEYLTLFMDSGAPVGAIVSFKHLSDEAKGV